MLQASLFRISPLALLLVLAACDTGEGTSLYDPNRATSSDPTIAAIAPNGLVLAGIDEVTITGSNFSATPDENLVFFGSAQAQVLSASPTELRVKAPNTPRENLPVRVAVRNAPNYSNTVPYSLTAAVTPFGDLSQSETAFGIAAGADGTLYVAIDSDGTREIATFAPDGTRGATPYFSTRFDFTTLALDPDGTLFATRGVFAAFRLPEGGTQETFGVISEGRPSLSALDIDTSGNLYVGGNNGDGTRSIYRIAPDESITAYPLDGNVRALAWFDGALFAATTVAGVSQVLRLPADASGDLGTPTVYADAAALGGAVATALAFAASGDLYVGTSEQVDPVIVVRPDGTAATLYPGVLTGPVARLAYGPDSALYMRTDVILNAENAVIQPSRLVRIETRQNGAS